MAVRLTYTNSRGLAEVIRIALGAAEIQFEESFIMTESAFRKLQSEGSLLFNQIPMLEIDGLQLVQSMSILRYICRKQGWLGKTPQESVRIDMLSDGARDMYQLFSAGHIKTLQSDQPNHEKDAVSKITDRYLPVFEKELKATGSGYLVGNSLTMCDIVFLDGLTYIAETHTDILEEFPNILNFLITMTSHPGIKNFLDGPQRKPILDKECMKAIYFLI